MCASIWAPGDTSSCTLGTWQDGEFHIRAVVRLQDARADARTLAQLRPIATVTGRGSIDITPSNVSPGVDAINGAIAMDY